MGVPIRVTDDAGNVYMVDPALLADPNEPKIENTIQPTMDGQIYQYVGGNWYRILRTDKVSWMTDVRPNVGVRKSQALAFALGQATGYQP